jgi:hypothetical protein
MQKDLGTTRIVDGWGKSFSLGEKLCPSIRLLGKRLKGERPNFGVIVDWGDLER